MPIARCSSSFSLNCTSGSRCMTLANATQRGHQAPPRHHDTLLYAQWLGTGLSQTATSSSLRVPCTRQSQMSHARRLHRQHHFDRPCRSLPHPGAWQTSTPRLLRLTKSMTSSRGSSDPGESSVGFWGSSHNILAALRAVLTATSNTPLDSSIFGVPFILLGMAFLSM